MPPSPWSATDRLLLFAYVESHGATDWRLATEIVPGKTAKQCRDQWCKSLAPSIKRALGMEATVAKAGKQKVKKEDSKVL